MSDEISLSGEEGGRARNDNPLLQPLRPSLAATAILSRGAIATLLLLSACGTSPDAPAGQVIARADGIDITRSELTAELLASQLPAGTDEAVAMRAVLQRLINRKLLAEVSRKQGWDESREYLMARERAEQDGLAQLALRQIEVGAGAPAPAEIDRFISDNPAMFAGRRIYVLDQVRFAQPPNIKDLSYLEASRTLDDVAAALTQNATRFERVHATLDTATLEPLLAQRIAKLPPGEVFVMTTGSSVLASVVREQHAAPVSQEVARGYAKLVLERRRAAKAVEARLAQLRRQARIDYQPGYGPDPAFVEAAAARGSPS